VELQCNSVLSSTDPQVDVSATILLDFLEVTGSALHRHYGQQFQKVLQLICTEYVPKIEQVILRSA
jgi:nucleoporin GLE1